MRKKCPYSELFWSVFYLIRTEYGEIRSISPYSVKMRENVDQNNSEYGHFLRSVVLALQKILFLHYEISFEKKGVYAKYTSILFIVHNYLYKL